MKSKHEHGFFLDPANPGRPVHMRLVWGEQRGWRRITRREAAAMLGGVEPLTVAEDYVEQPTPLPPLPIVEAPAPSLAEAVVSPQNEPVLERPRFEPPVPATPANPVHSAPLHPFPQPSVRDQERRTAAKSRLQDAVLHAGRQTALNAQMRYELALLAINGNVEAMVGFEPEAAIRGQSVTQLAHQIVTERRTAERRMLHAYAVLARISAIIDQARGAAIDDAADAGIREIRALED